MNALSSPIQLQFRYSEHHIHDVAGYFLPGGNVEEWLRAISSTGERLKSQRFAILPKSASDTNALGLLVMHAPSLLPDHSLPMGCLGDRLFLPTNAIPHVPVLVNEWPQLLRGDYAAWCWHPATGLVAIEKSDLLTVSDLLRPCSIQDSSWDMDLAPVRLNTRLHSLRIEQPPSVDDIITSGQGDIGSEGDQLRRSFENGPSLGSMLSQLGSFAMKPFSWMLEKLAGSGSSTPETPTQPKPQSRQPASPGWLGRGLGGIFGGIAGAAFAPFAAMAQGAAGMAGATGALNSFSSLMQHMSASLLSARRRELDRLMNMLEKDPDKGLKFAIPFGGAGGMFRGLSFPGWKLLENSLNLNFGGMGGGGLVDVWDIPANLQLQLLKRYKELAEREIRLGRYRRAAYIYGKLLGDLNAAADALRQGRFYHEAAVIYKAKLKRFRDAAECLEEGGHLEEAIEIYVELKQHEKVGDLYMQLDRTEEAADFFQMAVDDRLNQNDPLGAARILENKLREVDGALHVLHLAWPDSPQAQACLEREIELLGALGRHEETRKRAQDIATSRLTLLRRIQVAKVLSAGSHSYPDRLVQDDFKDLTLSVAAPALQGHDTRSRQLLNLIPGLAEEDRLLDRDCRRYDSKHTWKSESQRRPPPRKRNGFVPGKIVKVRTFRLPPGVNWKHAVSSEQGFFVAGISRRKLTVKRGGWDGLWQDEETWESNLIGDADVSLIYEPDDMGQRDQLHVLLSDGPRLSQKTLPDRKPFLKTQIESLNFVSTDTRSVTYSQATGQFYAVSGPELSFTVFDNNRVKTFSRMLLAEIPDLDISSDSSRPLPRLPFAMCWMNLHTHGAFLGVGRSLVKLIQIGSKLHIDCDRYITFQQEDSIQALACHWQNFHVAVSLESGVKLVKDAVTKSFPLAATEGFSNCQCEFMQDGSLVVVSDRYIWNYDIPHSGSPQLVAEQQHEFGSPRSVMRAKKHCAVLFSGGNIEYFQIIK